MVGSLRLLLGQLFCANALDLRILKQHMALALSSAGCARASNADGRRAHVGLLCLGPSRLVGKNPQN